MKYKNYIVVFLILMLTFVPNVKAAKVVDSAACYYKADNNKTLDIYIVFKEKSNGKIVGNGRIISFGGNAAKPRYSKRDADNITKSYKNNGYEMPARNVSVSDIEKDYNNCPKYVIVSVSGKDVILTDDETKIYPAITSFRQGAYSASLVTENEFWNLKLCNGEECILGVNVIVNCEDNELFGDPDESGHIENGKEIPPSLAYLINKALSVVRIVVPILIIILGMFDIAKAVVAAKEDEMRKAQIKFAKRVIAGICVFFVPVIVNLIMRLADIAWEGQDYEMCTIEQITKSN